MDIDFSLITVGLLRDQGQLSESCYNICISSGITNIESLLAYVHKYHSFRHLRHCGYKSKKELDELCLRIKNKDPELFSLFHKETLPYINLGSDYVDTSRVTLKTLRENGQISERSYNCCIFSDISTVEDLKSFYEKHRSFKSIRNCGIQSNNELYKICAKLPNEQLKQFRSNLESHFEDFTLAQLITDFKLSANCNTLCLNVGFYALSDILLYYSKYKGFTYIDGTSDIINKELRMICRSFSSFLIQLPGFDNAQESRSDFEFQMDMLQDKLLSLSNTQKYYIDSYVSSKAKSLSVRAFNVLDNYLEGNFSIFNIFLRILSEEVFKFKDLRNIGVNTEIELNYYINGIKSFLEKFLHGNSFLDSLEQVFHSFLKSEYNISEPHYKEVVETFRSLKSIPVFRTINILVDNHYLFKKQSDLVIFKTFFEVGFSDKARTYSSIANGLKLTRERVRQKCQNLLNFYTGKFSLLKYFDLNHLYLYDIDTKLPIIAVNDKLLEQVRLVENVNYNKDFIVFVLSQILTDTHLLFGMQLNNQNKYKVNRHSFKDVYLISQEIANVFDFHSFINDVANRINDKVEDTYYFNFQPYLIGFFKSKDIGRLDLISEICEQVLLDEMGVILDSENRLVFERNTFKNSGSYIIDILIEHCRPMHVSEIFNLLEGKYPGLFKGPESVRSQCQRMSGTKLIYFGRSSTYALKEWENDGNNIKGGTIRDIVEEYLAKSNTPRHIDEISKYVKRFRPRTNRTNILTNLKIDTNSRFLFYENATVGLPGKKYLHLTNRLLSSSDSNDIDWDDRLQLLYQFVNDNQKMPSLRNGKHESSLYNYFLRQKEALKDNRLSSDNIQKFEDFIAYATEFLPTANQLKDWELKMQMLYQFVKDYQRLPSSYNRKEESYLYGFFSRQKKAFNENKLSPDQHRSFKGLIDLAEYSNTIVLNDSTIKDFEAQLQSLYEFAFKWHRLPSRVNEKDEYMLYFFFQRLLKAFQGKKLLPDYNEKVKAILGFVKKARPVNNSVSQEWHKKMDLLHDFFLINHRLPSPRKDSGESSLYRFYVAQSKALVNNKLTPDQVKRYKKVASLLEKHKPTGQLIFDFSSH